MKDLIVNRRTLPDWSPVKSLVMVYPYQVSGRKPLLPFYNKFLSYIPDDIKIVLLVNAIKAKKEIERQRIEFGITNEIEFMVFPDLFDIWVRDYAPLITEEEGLYFPVKFNYNPSYVQKNYSKYIEEDNKIGEEIGKKLVSKGIRSMYFNWDIGNLTHNGAGTAIISNQFIADNKTSNIKHELESILHLFCGFSRIIFIPTEPDDITGHVDGMCRFIDEKTLVVGAYPAGSPNSKFYDILANNLQKDLGDKYTIIRLQNGDPEDDESEGIGSAVGNHMNFLRLGDKILFPYYGQAISEEPIRAFQNNINQLESGIEIVSVNIPELLDLARLGGVLNCISWQVSS